MKNKILVTEKDIIKTYSKQQQQLAFQYLKVIKFRKKFGWSKYKIAEYTNIPIGRIKHWIYEGVKPVPIKIVEELKSKGLVPFSTNNKNFDVIVEILAFIFGDGHLSENFILFSNKRKRNLIELKKKLKRLKFYGKFSKKVNKNHIMPSGRKLSGTSYDFRVCSSALTRMIISLGGPAGDKTINPVYLPKWLIMSSNEITSKFLGVFYANEGGTPTLCNNTICGLRIKASKNIELRKEHEYFLNQIRYIFKRLNIQTSGIKWENAFNKRKNGDITQPAYFNINNAFENFLIFSSRVPISYNYEKKKKIDSVKKQVICRVLRYLKNCEKYDKAKDLSDSGVNLNRISKELGLNYKTAQYWFKNGKPMLYNKRHSLSNLVKV